MSEKINGVWDDGDVDEILASYLETAVWSSTDADGNELDEKHSSDDFAPEAVEKARTDIVHFLSRAKQLTPEVMYDLCMEVGRIGHDFWLTRNHHGAGFWDGDYSNHDYDLGDELTKIAQVFVGRDVVEGDDGKLYLE